VFVPEERTWLRHAFESGRFLPPMDPASALDLLDRITQVEVFERFLHRTFPGKTRFSIEGVDMLVPILDSLIAGAATHGARHTIIGMAHRGRLNVLAHILEKPYAQILAEFKDPVAADALRIDLGWMGDVKYHAGRQHHRTRESYLRHDAAESEPSRGCGSEWSWHGQSRRHHRRSPGPPQFDGVLTLPILIHGDAAFPGQGIVAETLNLSRLSGYDTSGTIHIIANNQLGFTATPDESYSTSYASGLARGFKIPIVHVNADDPAACLEAARLAWEYRARFGLDFLIDLIGYRRFGHNEGDEPGVHTAVDVQAHRHAQDRPRAVCRSTRPGDGASRGDRTSGEEILHRARTGVRVTEARGRLRAAGVRAGARRARPRRPKRASRSSVSGRSTTRCRRRLKLHVPQEARARPRAPEGDVQQPDRPNG
jgi:2-oxoglutarate dehydrogenase E1 component